MSHRRACHFHETRSNLDPHPPTAYSTMTKREYQELIEFLEVRFQRLEERFDRLDASMARAAVVRQSMGSSRAIGGDLPIGGATRPETGSFREALSARAAQRGLSLHEYLRIQVQRIAAGLPVDGGPDRT
ncbi:MAG: hypothetical protein WEA09_15885 [Gemmatimonadota bacterium]